MAAVRSCFPAGGLVATCQRPADLLHNGSAWSSSFTLVAVNKCLSRRFGVECDFGTPSLSGSMFFQESL
jgi:hypothetical protein